MSAYTVVGEVSRALQALLWNQFKDDNAVRGSVPDQESIVLRNPTLAAANPSARLSLWLYQITENEHLKNRPPRRAVPPAAAAVAPPPTLERVGKVPLALDLYYLVTPLLTDDQAEQIVLGKALQVFYDHPMLLVTSPPPGPGDPPDPAPVAEELRIVLSRLSLEEITRIWEALREPYRLSVCIQVRVTQIDSTEVAEQTRVLERVTGFTRNPREVRELREFAS